MSKRKTKRVPWNKTDSNSVCKECGKVFHCAPSRINDKKTKRGLYCSRKCKDKSQKGKQTWNTGIVGQEYKSHYKNGFGGTFFKSGRTFTGSIEEYRSLHHWVRKTLGKPNVCEGCGGIFTGKNIQWASKSRSYKKERGDWIRLCCSCHYIYDRKEQRENKKLERSP